MRPQRANLAQRFDALQFTLSARTCTPADELLSRIPVDNGSKVVHRHFLGRIGMRSIFHLGPRLLGPSPVDESTLQMPPEPAEG